MQKRDRSGPVEFFVFGHVSDFFETLYFELIFHAEFESEIIFNLYVSDFEELTYFPKYLSTQFFRK